MPNMDKNAYVRCRGDEWFLQPLVAAELESQGRIWRDYDCEQNTVDNGFPDEGPCYGVTGDEDSAEELFTISILNEVCEEF